MVLILKDITEFYISISSVRLSQYIEKCRELSRHLSTNAEEYRYVKIL